MAPASDDAAVFPLEDIRHFLQPLARFSGLRLSYFPSGSDEQSLITGETAFCLQLRSTAGGAQRCHRSCRELINRSRMIEEQAFGLCHALMGQVAVPLSVDGEDLGTVIVCQAMMGGFSEEHKDHLRVLASELGQESPDSLLAAAAQNPVLSRSRLESLGSFIQEQLADKLVSRDQLENTTEFLLEKYEELMFLYTIAESISPDQEYSKTISVILDKGLQKLSAGWGLCVLEEEGAGVELEPVLSYGVGEEAQNPGAIPEELSQLIRSCSGPALILKPDLVAFGWQQGTRTLLACPFRIKNYRKGFILFGWETVEGVGDSELKFATALSSQAASVLHGVHLYRELADLLFSTLEALSSAIDAKDPYTHGHSQRVADYAILISRTLGFSAKFLTRMKIAGMLHDFGKIGVSEKILSKAGTLDTVEKEDMKEHPVIGARILNKFKSFSDIVPGIRHHHESFDGTGYPDGLKGEEIPLVGRMIAIADAFDAMTTSRPYRRMMSRKEAQEELRRFAGVQFDPDLVETFISALEGRQDVGQEA